MTLRCCTLRATVVALSLALTWGWFSPAAAQNRTEPNLTQVFRAAPRELTLRLARARKAIDALEYNEAVSELGRLLAELDDAAPGTAPGEDAPQDYFVGNRGEQGTHVSLKIEAQRLIGSMPAKGREWYELQYGAEARQLLEQAAESGDVLQLTNVARRYFHTKAGYEATLLLGRHYLDQGQPLAAALCFRRLAESPAAATFEPELSVLTASCWLHSSAPDRAQQTLAGLIKKLPGAQLRVGGQSITLPRDERQAREQLETLLGARQMERSGPLVQWAMFRGDATRTARTTGDSPLSQPRWRLPTANNPNDEKLLEQLSRRFIAQSIPAVPSVQPLAVQDFILMRTADGLLGVDVRTGKRVWPYPWDEMEAAGPQPPGRGLAAGANASLREAELRQRLFEDAPYGQVSSDGQAVYLLHALNFASSNSAMMAGFGMPGMGRAGAMRNAAGSNRLVALDIGREGKHLWVIGDAQGGGGDEPKLAGAFFLGPPLPLQGKLYALAEINSEVRLVVLNPRTGQLEWQQQLAQLEARNIAVDVNRRLAGASPSFADGVMVCPTSAGAVVAIDISTRTLLWGFQYSLSSGNENRQGPVFFPRQMQMLQPKALGQHWVDATVTIHDGRVLVTPVEADEMFCLDLLSGKLLWPAQKRNDLLYVATVHKGNAIFVGKSQLIAIRLADGKPAWPNPVEIPNGGMPSGRGFHSDTSYYLPTTAQELLKVDLDAGRIVQQLRTDKILGNLICYRDEIISQGVDSLAVYPMVAPLRERVAATLRQSPTDPWALGRQAELEIYDGRRDQALEILRRACQLHPQDASLRELLIVSLMAALREDFPRYRARAGELEQLVEEPAQREQFLRLMAAGLRQVNEGEGAFAMLLKLIDLESTAISTTSSNMEDLHPRHTVRRDRWVSAQLASLYRLATPEQRRPIDQVLDGRRQEAESSDSLSQLRRYVRYFGFHPSSLPIRLTLARKLIDIESWVEAEVLLASLENHPDPAISGAAVALTARLLRATRQTEHAAQYYARLAQDFARVVCLDGQTGQQLAEEANRDGGVKAAFQQVQTGWPYGRVTVQATENAALRNAAYGRLTQISLRETVGATPPGLNIIFDQQRNHLLMGKDGFGREQFQATLIRPDGTFGFYYVTSIQNAHARALGHLVFVHMGAEVVAVNALRSAGRSDETIRWRADIVHRLGDNDHNPRTKVSMRSFPWGGMKSYVADQSDRPISPLGPCLATGIYVQKNRDIQCLDPLSGDVLWSRADFPPGCDLFGDEEFLFVAAPGAKELQVLHAIDGQDVAQRPLPPNEQRWTSNGRRLLAWTDSPDGNHRHLRLYDAWSSQTLFEATCPIGARGTVLLDHTLALLQPDGQLQVVSLANGQRLVQVGVEAEPSLVSVHLQRTSDGFCVVTNRQGQGASSAEVVAGSANSQIVNGRVYAFDGRTGKIRWPVPATVEQFGLLLDQPTESPLLIFMRKSQRGPNQSSLLCLDKRDGRIVYYKDDIPVQANFAEVIVRPDQHKISITMGARSFTLTMTSDPIPPEPPGQLGAAASVLPGSERASGGWLNSLFEALGRGLAPAPEE